MITSSTHVPSFPLRLETRITNALNGCFLFNLFDDAIADLLCLQTCTHGTSPKCYNRIMRIGTDPNWGGKGGECAFYRALGYSHDEDEIERKKSGWNCEKRFFVFLPECPAPIKRWQPRVYSIVACIGENCHPQQHKLKKLLWITVSFFEGFCSPTLKFRFRAEGVKQFQWDETFGQTARIAGYTQKTISADHIGLYGSLKEGINKQWGQRIKHDPLQFAKGLLKLVATIASIAVIIFAVIYSPLLATVCLIYGIVKSIQILGRFFLPLFWTRQSIF